MASIDLYVDAALSTAAVSPLEFVQDNQGVAPPHARRFFLGSIDAAGTLFEAASNPGVDQITLSITDADPGAHQETTSIKLARTEAGLATAVPGAALDLGTSITAGAAGAVEVWVQWTDSTAVAYTDGALSLVINTLQVTLP